MGATDWTGRSALEAEVEIEPEVELALEPELELDSLMFMLIDTPFDDLELGL